MEFNIYLLLAIVAAVAGVILVQMGIPSVDMSSEQSKSADLYRNYGYLSLGVAVILGMYYYYEQRQSANMCGGMHKAYMCGRMY